MAAAYWVCSMPDQRRQGLRLRWHRHRLGKTTQRGTARRRAARLVDFMAAARILKALNPPLG